MDSNFNNFRLHKSSACDIVFKQFLLCCAVNKDYKCNYEKKIYEKCINIVKYGANR